MKRTHIFLLATLIGVFSSPLVSLAQSDSRCWIREDCIANRKADDLLNTMTDAEAAKGFITSTATIEACGVKDAAGKALGFCLPETKAITKTSFGNRNVFNDIGDFINHIYRYGIIVAGVLAILMIIAAGFIWTTSGGNSERISSAKKRIAGSLMGLFLAVLSYSLLNVINPNLVSIRLPQVWKINTKGITPPYCKDLKGNTLLAELGPSTLSAEEREQRSKTPPTKEQYTITSSTAYCGVDYFVDGTDGLSCAGTVCKEDKQVCSAVWGQSGVRTCQKASIIGTISTSAELETHIIEDTPINILTSIVGDGFEWPWAEDQEIYVICKSGEYYSVTKTSKNEPDNDSTQKDPAHFTQQHWILVSDQAVDDAAKKCSGEQGVRGFAYSLDMNEEADPGDERHLFGKLPGAALATDIGRTQSESSENILNKDCVNPYLFSAEEIKQGFELNIDAKQVCDIETGGEGDILRKQCYGNLGKSADVGYEKTAAQCTQIEADRKSQAAQSTN